MPGRKTPPDPMGPSAASGEPKLSVSFFGFKIDGSGAAGVRFAFWIALTVCGLAALNVIQHLVH